MKAVFDIEANGLEPTRVWCIYAKLHTTPWIEKFFGPEEIESFGDWLKENHVDTLVGHNIIGYDIPVLEKLVYGFKWEGAVEDTLVMSRLDNPSRKHNLKAWGEYLGDYKIGFEDFTKYSDAMKEYCIQDVSVTYKVYDLMLQSNLHPTALEIEHEVAKVIHQQTENGWRFDYIKATSLMAELKDEMMKAEDTVREVFQPLPTFKPVPFPKNPYKKDGSVSAALQRHLDNQSYLHPEKGWGHIIYPEFNLASRQQIGRYLQHFGWNPLEYTETGQPIVSETILEKVDIPEAQLIAKYLMLQKRLGLLDSWMDSLRITTSRIHGSVNSNGARTGRMTHSKPNLAQVPAVYSPYGDKCRALFKVEKGYKLVGVDASGLELRMLAHYMNDKKYTEEILNGDIHTANQMAAQLESRDEAKTFIYAFLYGAGDEKIGSIIGGEAEDGKRLKTNFLDNTPALADLRRRITKMSQSGRLEGLDGRQLLIDKPHTALNTLFQSAGAIVMKKALLILKDKADAAHIDYKFVGNIHDEIQTEVIEDQADMFGRLAVQSIVEAGEYFNLNCPLDGEYKIGDNWSETH